jgi:hypothetical protein
MKSNEKNAKLSGDKTAQSKLIMNGQLRGKKNNEMVTKVKNLPDVKKMLLGTVSPPLAFTVISLCAILITN